MVLATARGEDSHLNLLLWPITDSESCVVRCTQQVKDQRKLRLAVQGGGVKVGKGAEATWQMRIQDGFQLPLVANARHPDLCEAVGQCRTDLALPKVATCHATSSLSDGAHTAIQPQSLSGSQGL